MLTGKLGNGACPWCQNQQVVAQAGSNQQPQFLDSLLVRLLLDLIHRVSMHYTALEGSLRNTGFRLKSA